MMLSYVRKLLYAGSKVAKSNVAPPCQASLLPSTANAGTKLEIETRIDCAVVRRAIWTCCSNALTRAVATFLRCAPQQLPDMLMDSCIMLRCILSLLATSNASRRKAIGWQQEPVSPIGLRPSAPSQTVYACRYIGVRSGDTRHSISPSWISSAPTASAATSAAQCDVRC
jgi:hypothetical protein